MNLDPPPQVNEFNFIWQKWLNNLYEWNRINSVVDYNLEVLRGNITGHSMVSISGHDDTVPNGGPFGLSPGFGAASYQFNQSVIAATPAAVIIGSSDNTNDNVGGTGALTLRVTGLNASGVVANETVTMAGTTGVTTSATWSGINKLTVLTTGSANANTGTIWCGTGALTAGVPAVRMASMEIGHNLNHTGYYVVPAANTLYLRKFTATVASTNKDVEVEVQYSAEGSQWYTIADFGVEAGDFSDDIQSIAGFPAGYHIRITAKGGAASTIVTAIIAAELVAT